MHTDGPLPEFAEIENLVNGLFELDLGRVRASDVEEARFNQSAGAGGLIEFLNRKILPT